MPMRMKCCPAGARRGSLSFLAAERWKRDLAGCDGFRFDDGRADRTVGFIEKLPHVIGDYAARGAKLRLLGWQVFFVANLFGWIDANGLRRFRSAYLQVARGSGKSVLVSGLSLYSLCADGEESAQVFVAATDAKPERRSSSTT